jgi:hypothetical protein
MFRDKMRNVPYLAYGIGRDNIDRVEGFRNFFKNFPPVLSIEKFSFDEKSTKTKKAEDIGYQ